MKIGQLTKEQEAKMYEVRSEWINFARSGKVIDHEKGKELIYWLYEFSKLKKPLVIFVESPLGAQIAVHYLKAILNGKKDFNQVWDQVRGQVWDQVRGQVWGQVRDQVRDQVRGQVWDQVRDQVWGQKLEWNDFAYYGGYSDFGWLAFYSYFEEVFGINKDHEAFHKFRELIRLGVYDMIQLEGVCIVCPQPAVLNWNERGRLHSEIQATVSWKDGYKLHYLNGIYFTEELWMSIVHKTITSKEALAIKSADQRAIALNYIGGEKR